jgi:hypothetical protein
MTTPSIRIAAAISFWALAPLFAAAPARSPIQAKSASVVNDTTTADPAEASVTTGTTGSAETDSNETRETFSNLLQTYPPEVGMVLKLDPSLFSNPSWLATYPSLQAFVGAHPEIAHNPAFFLAHVTPPAGPKLRDFDSGFWMQMMGGFTAFIVFVIVTITLAWLVKTLVEQRRWSRQSRVQTEAHNKLLERFTTNEELLAYVQSPAGKRFLESAPIALEAAPRPLAAPVGRFLWSIQIGLVLAACGIGLHFVAGPDFPVEVKRTLTAFGIVVLSVGVGFVLSGIVSFVLSQRLGLVGPATSPGDEGPR